MCFFGHGFGQLGHDPARMHGERQKARLGLLYKQEFRKLQGRPLGRPVRTCLGTQIVSCDGIDVDHCLQPVRRQERREALAHEKHSPQIDFESLPPSVRVRLNDRPRRRHEPGVVDQHIQPRRVPLHLQRRLFDRFPTRHVQIQAEHLGRRLSCFPCGIRNLSLGICKATIRAS
jgi:hypothetical protein